MSDTLIVSGYKRHPRQPASGPIDKAAKKFSKPATEAEDE